MLSRAPFLIMLSSFFPEREETGTKRNRNIPRQNELDGNTAHTAYLGWVLALKTARRRGSHKERPPCTHGIIYWWGWLTWRLIKRGNNCHHGTRGTCNWIVSDVCIPLPETRAVAVSRAFICLLHHAKAGQRLGELMAGLPLKKLTCSILARSSNSMRALLMSPAAISQNVSTCKTVRSLATFACIDCSSGLQQTSGVSPLRLPGGALLHEE